MPEVQMPTDAIELQEAIMRFGHSREWYRNHMPIYYAQQPGQPRKAYVSEAQARAEHEKSQQISVRYPEQGC